MLNLYPNIYYRISDFDTLKVKDITIGVRLKEFINSYKNLAYKSYVIKNGERPDQVSNKIYGAPKFDYILLLVNDIRNLYTEWPMSSQTFDDYIIAKYGSIAQAQSSDNGLYFTGTNRQISRSAWIALNDEKKYFKSFFEHESDMNTQKSFIRYIEYDKAIAFEVQLKELMFKYSEVTE